MPIEEGFERLNVLQPGLCVAMMHLQVLQLAKRQIPIVIKPAPRVQAISNIQTESRKASANLAACMLQKQMPQRTETSDRLSFVSRTMV